MPLLRYVLNTATDATDGVDSLKIRAISHIVDLAARKIPLFCEFCKVSKQRQNSSSLRVDPEKLLTKKHWEQHTRRFKLLLNQPCFCPAIQPDLQFFIVKNEFGRRFSSAHTSKAKYCCCKALHGWGLKVSWSPVEWNFEWMKTNDANSSIFFPRAVKLGRWAKIWANATTTMALDWYCTMKWWRLAAAAISWVEG